MSQRTDQVGSLLRERLARFLSHELELPPDVLVTVTSVTVSPDLKHATAEVSVLPESRRGTVLTMLRKLRAAARRAIAEDFHAHAVPSIRFRVDDRESYAATIERLLDEVAKELPPDDRV